MLKQCEQCGKQYKTSKKDRRHCSVDCARLDPSTKCRQIEGLKKAWKDNPSQFSHGEAHSQAVGKSTKGKYRQDNISSLLTLSKRTVRKVLSRLKISCVRCGWNEGVCDLHHIKGRGIENADAHFNLAYVCPNCHRLIHAKKVDGKSLQTFEDMIGDLWKRAYFG